MLSVGYTASNVAMGVVIVCVTVSPRGSTSRALSWRPLVFVGTISYSLYLWQQPFLYFGDDPPFFAQKWWSIPAMIALAVFSYFVVERPALALKSRFSRRTSPT